MNKLKEISKFIIFFITMVMSSIFLTMIIFATEGYGNRIAVFISGMWLTITSLLNFDNYLWEKKK